MPPAFCFEPRPALVVLKCIALSALVVCGCQDIKRESGLRAILSRVRTPADERQAFIEIHARSNPPEVQLAFKPLGKDGKQVDMAAALWWQSVEVLKLSLGDETVYHQVLDVENIGLLMGE
jgi:hypothetical protein